MSQRALIAGAGIGGLASAIGCARAGCGVRVFERSADLSSIGAGIQLGPNATRILKRWDLGRALTDAAATPERLVVRNAHSGRELGALPLGQHMVRRYGAPYLTIHRGDLQALLHAAAGRAGASIELATPIEGLGATTGQVSARLADGREASADLLIGADGLWSRVREQLLSDGPPRATGHLAYRALLPRAALPERPWGPSSGDVNVWVGQRLHVVAYPVRGGQWLNLVGIVHAKSDIADPRLAGWDHATNADNLRAALAGCCAALQDLVRAVPDWRLWVLCNRPPMRGPHEHARGRVALVGDAAHPMVPYLAQGAGMAIEDAAELEAVLRRDPTNVPRSLQRFATSRWQRNARVQARAARNGRIFHASGPLAWGRDASIQMLGARLLDLPWLYGGRAPLPLVPPDR